MTISNPKLAFAQKLRRRRPLVAALTLALLSPFTLDAMELVYEMNEMDSLTEEVGALTITQPTSEFDVWKTCLLLSYTFYPKEFAHNDIAKCFFSSYKKNGPLFDAWVDDIAQNCRWLLGLSQAVDSVWAACGPEVSAKILRKALLQAGVSLCDIKGPESVTLLHVATCNGRTEVVKFLLASVPQDMASDLISVKDMYGYTALHYAVRRGQQTAIVQALLAAITPEQAWKLICIQNNYGDTALDFAEEEIKLIMEKYRPTNGWGICVIS